MRKLAHHQIPRLAESDIDSAERHPVVVLLENIRSAHNVGSIFRTADALRIDRIILSGFTPDPGHKGVRKSALGAGDFVPWSRTEDAAGSVQELAAEGYTVAALEITDTPTDPRSLSLKRFPLLMVVGNEVEGVSETLLARSDLALELPQYGINQSLNVSVAAGVALYDVVRTYRSLRA